MPEVESKVRRFLQLTLQNGILGLSTTSESSEASESSESTENSETTETKEGTTEDSEVTEQTEGSETTESSESSEDSENSENNENGIAVQNLQDILDANLIPDEWGPAISLIAPLSTQLFEAAAIPSGGAGASRAGSPQ